MVLKRPSGQREEDDYEANHQAKQRFASSKFVINSFILFSTYYKSNHVFLIIYIF